MIKFTSDEFYEATGARMGTLSAGTSYGVVKDDRDTDYWTSDASSLKEVHDAIIASILAMNDEGDLDLLVGQL